MTQDDVSLLLAVLGGVYVLTACIGRRSGDAWRDSALMAAVGTTKLAIAAILQFS